MTNEPIHVTDASFEETVLKSTIPVVVDFWAVWCVPCKRIAPVLEKLAEEYGDKLVIAKVDVDKNSKWAMKYGVQGIPTMLLIANGKVIHRQTGALPESVIRETIAQFVSVVSESKHE